MLIWWKKQIINLGFEKVPYDNKALSKPSNFVFQQVRLIPSSLVKGSYMFGLRIGLSTETGLLHHVIRPEGVGVILMDYWMGPDEISPLEWSCAKPWSPSQKQEMTECFRNQGLPWLERFSDAQHLVAQLESWQINGKPNPPDWPQGKLRKVPIDNLYLAAIWEYLGQIDKFKAAFMNWIDFLQPEAKIQKEERDRCLEYYNRF